MKTDAPLPPPQSLKREPSTIITIRVPRRLLASIDAEATARGVTRTALMLHAVQYALEHSGDRGK